MLLDRLHKQPNETMDYYVDYAQWFANRSDTPASSNVIVPAGITLVSQTLNGLVVRVLLSGGATGQSYKVTVRLTTSSGVIKEDDFIVKVREV